jgi:hypothetical protein
MDMCAIKVYYIIIIIIITSFYPAKSPKGDIGVEPRRRVLATSAVKGLIFKLHRL